MRSLIKHISLYALLVISSLFIFGMPLLADAAPAPHGYEIITSLPGTEITKDTPVGDNITLQKYIQQIYLFALGIVGLVAVVAIVFWAFMYIMAAGNPSKMSDAMGGIKDAVLGLVLMLLAALILGLINPKLVTLRSFDELIIPIPGGGSNSQIPQIPFEVPTWVQKQTQARGGFESCSQACVGCENANVCDLNTEPAPKGNNLCCIKP